MTRAVRILDHIGTRAACTIPDALARSIAECDATLADAPSPSILVDELQGIARELAELAFLDLWDQSTSGQIPHDYNFDKHFFDVGTSFATRVDIDMRLVRAVPADWRSLCLTAIQRAFQDRINQLGASGPAGGWA